jgi:two-component system cell cycle response regulator
MTEIGSGATAVSENPSWLPRLTGKVMVDLQLWMVGFGLLIGLLFPFVVVLLGVSSDVALRPVFFAATLIAGLIVAAVNMAIARAVVGVRLRSLTVSMRKVDESLTDAAFQGDWSACDPESCSVPVDSADEFGEAATSFNRLVVALATSHQVAEGITSVADALAAHLEMDSLAQSMLSELSAQTGCDAAALVVVRRGQVEVAGSTGLRDEKELASSEAVLSALSSNKAGILQLPEDVVVSGALIDVVPQEVQVLPVRFGVVTVGVLVLAFIRPSSREARAVLDATLPGIAVALHNSLNHEDLQRVAALDQLTGIYNRRFGMRRLTEEFGRSVRSGDPMGLLMFDLDHFKEVNDTYGHLVGDQVLRTVVGAARAVLREGDVLIRYGGEEFLVVMPGAGRSDLTKMAERVRRAISESEISEAGQRVLVTVSIGGAGLPDTKAANPNDLIGVVDQALYTAKQSGRDRSVVA